MAGPTRILYSCILTAAVCIVTSCAGMSLREERSWKPIPIADFKSVVGKWEGTVVESPSSFSAEDWVRLNIFGTGIYEFTNLRMIDVWEGSGNFTLVEGRLVSQSDKGNMVLLLLSDKEDRERIIHAQAVSSEGHEFSARLKRTSELPLPLSRRSRGSPPVGRSDSPVN
jgi:hypothetical protein